MQRKQKNKKQNRKRQVLEGHSEHINEIRTPVRVKITAGGKRPIWNSWPIQEEITDGIIKFFRNWESS